MADICQKIRDLRKFVRQRRVPVNVKIPKCDFRGIWGAENEYRVHLSAPGDEMLEKQATNAT